MAMKDRIIVVDKIIMIFCIPVRLSLFPDFVCTGKLKEQIAA